MDKLTGAQVMRGGLTSSNRVVEDYGVESEAFGEAVFLYTEIPSKGGGVTSLRIRLDDRAIQELLRQLIFEGGFDNYVWLRDCITACFDQLALEVAAQTEHLKESLERAEEQFDSTFFKLATDTVSSRAMQTIWQRQAKLNRIWNETLEQIDSFLPKRHSDTPMSSRRRILARRSVPRRKPSSKK